jgi:predicted Zn-dependent peptidase
MLGDASEVNREEEKVEAITSSDVQSFSREYLRPENSNIMYYLRKS